MKKNFMRSTFALALSITAMPILVNGQDQSLSSVNSAKSSNPSALKDSVKDTKAGVAELIETLMKVGSDGNVSSSLAPVIGLPSAMPIKALEFILSEHGSDREQRGCFVVYEIKEGSDPKVAEKRPVCAYILKSKRSSANRQTSYFRIDLNGNLEKVVVSKGKHDESGKVVRGSGVKTDLDINSPEVKKTFDAEMKFWLKDWLKKQQKVPAKKA